MKKFILGLLMVLGLLGAAGAAPVPADDAVGQKTQAYFDDVFAKLKLAADQQPDAATFREAMKPVVAGVPGVFGGSFIDKKWVIRQVLFPSHFLARGFDLKGVSQLHYFQDKLKEAPGPQLSEPAHGNLMQPRLIAMRYPVIKDGKVAGLVSVMVRTPFFLKAVGLDQAKAYKIICLGKEAESVGTLGENYKEFKLALPSTEWVIKYKMQ
ncbi:MAG: hypothetical protein HQL22_04650 [Candidatus Omnitrophica bacterium]|nr:hypothetical protein [Candidatus Omnitrophota bacterium]